MDKTDRNTILLIFIVFIVSIASLIAVLSISWRLVGGSVKRASNAISRFVQLQDLDYNFEIPEVGE